MVKKTLARLMDKATGKELEVPKKVSHRLMAVVRMQDGKGEDHFVITSKEVMHSEGAKYLDEEPRLLQMAFGFSTNGLSETERLPAFQRDLIVWHPFFRDWSHIVNFQALTEENAPRYDACDIARLSESEFADKIQLP